MSKPPTQTILAHLMDRPGALSRVLNVFKKRGLNVASLHVAQTAETGVSMLTMTVEADDLGNLRPQLERIIDVLDVQIVAHGDASRPTPKTTQSQADGVVG